MTNPDYRALCAEMLEAFDGLPCETNYKGQSRPIVCIDEEPFDRARTLLAEPGAGGAPLSLVTNCHTSGPAPKPFAHWSDYFNHVRQIGVISGLKIEATLPTPQRINAMHLLKYDPDAKALTEVAPGEFAADPTCRYFYVEIVWEHPSYQPPSPISAHDLAIQWNQQADQSEQWDSLELYEQLAFAQSRAIAADRSRHPTPQPPADGEVGELVGRLKELAHAVTKENWREFDMRVPAEPRDADLALTRAADLLERLASPACLVINPSPEALASLKAAGPGIIEAMPAERMWPAPVPVSERPWEREGWCDEQGQCWMGDPGGGEFIPSWRLCRPDDAPAMKVSIPFNALPLPQADDN